MDCVCGKKIDQEALRMAVDHVLEDGADLGTLECVGCVDCAPQSTKGYLFDWDDPPG